MARLYFGMKFLQLVTPPVIGSILFTINLMCTAVASLWVGVPQATDKIANEWTLRAIRSGLPTIWDTRTYWIIRVMAFLTILAGWVLLSHATVWLTRLIF